jgi:hypothetical protein
MARITIDSGTQRQHSNDVLLEGVLYGTSGLYYAVRSVHYSATGPEGPWSECQVLSGDPDYDWTIPGHTSGVSYALPVRVPYSLSGRLW